MNGQSHLISTVGTSLGNPLVLTAAVTATTILPIFIDHHDLVVIWVNLNPLVFMPLKSTFGPNTAPMPRWMNTSQISLALALEVREQQGTLCRFKLWEALRNHQKPVH